MALPELFANSPVPGSVVALTTLATNQASTSSLAFTMTAAAPAALQGSGQFRVVIGSEIVIFDASQVATTNWTALARGAETSTAATHSTGDGVLHYLTAGALANLNIGTGMISQYWYGSQGQGSQTFHSASFAAGTITAYPLSIREPVVTDALGIRNGATQAGATLLAGLYTDNGSGYPAALIANTSVSFGISASTGNLVGTFGANVIVSPPLVWVVALNTGATATLNSLAANTSALDAMPMADTANSFDFNPMPGFVKTGTGFVALPANFPAVVAGMATSAAPVDLYLRAH